jgi:(p)ppGpp synthase/HD superfamily hydrolase
MDLTTYVDWCIAQHDNTNHMYDKYIPYSFHLRMVDRVAQQFEHLLDDTKDMQTGKSREILDGSRIGFVSLRMACRKAGWGHDTIEDTRTSYNDVVNHLGKDAADIVYAVTNEKGKNRAERANDKYYAGIVATPGAVFVKLCDRIANVQYGKMTGSSMYDKYKKENANFVTKLGGDDKDHKLAPMFEYLLNLFKD